MEPSNSPGTSDPWLLGLVLTLAGIGGAVFAGGRHATISARKSARKTLT